METGQLICISIDWLQFLLKTISEKTIVRLSMAATEFKREF